MILGRSVGRIGGGGTLVSNTGLRKTGIGGPSAGWMFSEAGSGWGSVVVDSSRLISSSLSTCVAVLGSEASSIRSYDKRLASFSLLTDGRYLVSWLISWESFALGTCFFLVDNFLLATITSSVEDAGKDLGHRG